MTEKKLKTFEEKINAFLKHFESGAMQRQSKDYFLKKYAYLETDEIEKLFLLCHEIEDTAYQLACQTVEKDIPIEIQRVTIQGVLGETYPYLDEVRMFRLISRKLYWANH